jgi:FO synthase
MIIAIVPMKPLALAKQRLSGILPDTERQELVRSMFCDVLEALLNCEHIAHTYVVTADRQVAALAASHGAGHIAEAKPAGLNEAVVMAVEQLEESGADTMLVLPGDVPLVTPAEISELALHAQPQSVTVVLAHDGEGTNALMVSPPGALIPVFGTDSFSRHLEAARNAGMAGSACHFDGLGRDIDNAGDLAFLRSRMAGRPEYAFLRDTVSGAFASPEKIHRTAAPINPERAISAAASGKALRRDQAMALADCKDNKRLCAVSENLALAGHGDRVSFSKKVFIPLTKLCRDVCHYCTFARTPKKIGSAYLSIDEVVEIAQAGREAGCKEALFTLGDKPELRYRAAREALKRLGHVDTLSYLEEASKAVLDETGLLPHLNAGVMDELWLERLRGASISQGIMLESASPRLMERGMAHHGSPDKAPEARLATLEAAGKAAVPFTTGLLIGIGETRIERIEAMLVIRDLHDRYGHIQEIIIQNFRAKPDTRMANAPEPPLEEHIWTIAAARLIFGPDMNIQAPPNLQPGALEQLVRAGINDWGGVSPVTPDHVNPEAPWPHLDRLANATEQAGRTLVERLAIYPEYEREPDRWVSEAVRSALLKHCDGDGYAREDDWFAGSDTLPPVEPTFRTNLNTRHSALAKALESTTTGRLDEHCVETLFTAHGPAFQDVITAADELRRSRNGDVVSYVVNRNINYTNLCTYGCRFCAFSKGRVSQGYRDRPYDLPLEEIAHRTAEAWERGATEVCLQGGIGAHYTGDTYHAILKGVKAAAPDIHVHAFSPLEIWHGADTLGLPLQDYLMRLRDAGLASLPGTAAEILDDEVREDLCADKLNTAQWLEVMEAAHSVGLRSTATIMFGHIDRAVHWARHLLRVRDLQEKTGGFTEFVPLPFVHMEAPIYLKGEARRGPTWREAVLMHAVARLVLDPVITNIQASWVKMGPEGAARCLSAGVNDFGGSLMNESITRAAGAVHGQEMTPEKMETIIRKSGRFPLQRNTLYNHVTHNEMIGAEPDILPVSLRLVAAE